MARWLMLISNRDYGVSRALLCLFTSFSCFYPEKWFLSARICRAPGFLQQRWTLSSCGRKCIPRRQTVLLAVVRCHRHTKLCRSVQGFLKSLHKMYVCMLTPAGFSPSWAPLDVSRWLFFWQKHNFLSSPAFYCFEFFQCETVVLNLKSDRVKMQSYFFLPNSFP